MFKMRWEGCYEVKLVLPELKYEYLTDETDETDLLDTNDLAKNVTL